MKKILSVLLIALMTAAVGFSTGCSKNQLVVYTNAEFAPYEFMEGKNIVGVDIEIAKEIAKELGKKIKIVNIEFDALNPKLSNLKNNEIIIAGMTKTPEREEKATFSDTYAKSIQYIIYKSENYSTFEGLEGARVGVQLGTTGDYLLSDWVDGKFDETFDITIDRVSSAQVAALKLQRGDLDAVVVDKLPAENIANNYNGLTAVAAVYELDGVNIFEEEEYGIAVKKDNTELLDTINTVIARLIEEGKIDEWTNKFSGIEE